MQPPSDIAARQLNRRFEGASAEAVLDGAIARYEGRIALLSSFGAEAAIILHMLSKIAPDVPVLMLDTLLLFPETLSYQIELTAHLGLQDVRRITPDESADPDRRMHQRDSSACCEIRKVTPLNTALSGFDAVITGRKRFQTGLRADLARFEMDGARLKVNPLAEWAPADIAAYFETHALPRHPLVAKGYPSIGCAPCTTRVLPGEDPRAGRWRSEERDECGIHIGADGKIERRSA